MPEAPKVKLSAEEKKQSIAKHETTRGVEESAMEKKYNEIQNMAQNHEDLAKALKIDPKDINEYAKKSPKFAETLRGFEIKASTSHDKFKDWFKTFMQGSRSMTTKNELLNQTALLKQKLTPLRGQTTKSFAKIKTEMQTSVQNMVKNEKTRLLFMQYFTDVPSDIAKKFPKKQRAAIIQRLQSDIGYNDVLTKMQTTSFEEFKKQYTSAKFIIEQTKLLQNSLNETVNPGFVKFSNIRAERAQLTQQLLSQDAHSAFIIGEDFPGKTWGDIDLTSTDEFRNQNPWPLGTPITDAKEFLNPRTSEAEIKEINQVLSYQVQALKTMIKSNQAEQVLNDLNTSHPQFTDAWEANGADPNTTWQTMLEYTETPEEIYDFSLDKGQYFSPQQADKIIATAKKSMIALAKGVQQANQFNKLKTAVVSLNHGVDSGNWTLANINSPQKMNTAIQALVEERTLLVASRKGKKRKNSKA